MQEFSRLRELEAARQITIGIEYSAARELRMPLGGRLQRLATLILVTIPYLTIPVAIGFAIHRRAVGFLLGIPAAVAAFFLANPINPHRGCVTVVGLVALLSAVIAGAQGKAVLAFTLGCGLVTFAAVRTLYGLGTMALRVAALRSEPLFLYLYQRRLCTVRDNATGRIWAVARDWPQVGKENA